MSADIRVRVAIAYDDLLTEFCEHMQKLINRGETDADQIAAAIKAFDPFNDALSTAWDEWADEL